MANNSNKVKVQAKIKGKIKALKVSKITFKVIKTRIKSNQDFQTN